ncbi:ATPase, partial [Micromonospora sp. SL1-18]
MDGSETGWGRQAEPAPRWRALLDRARLARGAEHTEADRVEEHPPPPEPLPRRTAGAGWTGRAQPVGPPAEPTYRAEATYRGEPAYRAAPGYGAEPPYRGEPAYHTEPGHPAEPSWRAEPAYRTDPEPAPPRGRGSAPVESRYALLDGGYRPDPAPPESRYALLDQGRYRPEDQQTAEPSPPAPTYPAPPAVAAPT